MVIPAIKLQNVTMWMMKGEGKINMKKRLIILIALLLIAIAIFISDRYGDKLLPIKLDAEKIESIKISSHSWDEFPSAIMLNGVDNADEITEIVRLYNESVQHHDHGVGTTHPNYVKITYNNGKEISFWCGVGDFITTAKGKRQYNYVNGELDEYIGEMISAWEEENFFVGDANLTIVKDDLSIQPYRNFLSCTTYYEGEWLCADGMGAYFLLMEKEDELPVVLYDGMMEFIISNDAKVLGVSLFDANRGRTHHRIDEAEFFELCKNLDAGTYYVSVEVSYKGKYIEKEDKYESFADEYIFRMDVEEKAVEENSEECGFGDPIRRVKTVGQSYADLENLSADDRNKISEFDIELCYFKIKNIPEGLYEVYASIWEIGFISKYKNPNTGDRLELTWWANKEPEDYIHRQKENPRVKLITKNDIDYYCNFVKLGEEKPGETPYHAEIRWVEDGKCMYLNYVSATQIGEEVLKYCEIEKYSIE